PIIEKGEKTLAAGQKFRELQKKAFTEGMLIIASAGMYDVKDPKTKEPVFYPEYWGEHSHWAPESIFTKGPYVLVVGGVVFQKQDPKNPDWRAYTKLPGVVRHPNMTVASEASQILIAEDPTDATKRRTIGNGTFGAAMTVAAYAALYFE